MRRTPAEYSKSQGLCGFHDRGGFKSQDASFTARLEKYLINPLSNQIHPRARTPVSFRKP